MEGNENRCFCTNLVTRRKFNARKSNEIKIEKSDEIESSDALLKVEGGEKKRKGVIFYLKREPYTVLFIYSDIYQTCNQVFFFFVPRTLIAVTCNRYRFRIHLQDVTHRQSCFDSICEDFSNSQSHINSVVLY